MSFNLDKENYKIYSFEEIASTNDQAWKLIEQGESLPLIIVAKTQTSGKGQWGRVWQSLEGGLYLSLALKVELRACDALHLTMVTAYGIVKALRKNGIPGEIKWLNDLILNNRKLGGIKIETKIINNLIKTAVIGVGINWHNPIPELGINLQSFEQISSLEQLTEITLSGILSAYQEYLNTGIESILTGYLAYFYNLGKSIEIDGNRGIITGVTEQGELKIRLSSPGATTEICCPHGTISLGYN